MSVKCHQCGVETTLESAFFKSRKSFSSIHQFYCPSCWLKVGNAAAKKCLLLDLGLGLFGLLMVFFYPDFHWGYLLSNLLFFQMSLILTIVPHELGHAITARLLGERVFMIRIGTGRNLWKFDGWGFRFEIQTTPSGGLVFVAPPSLDCLRIKKFVHVAAGPMVNLLLVGAILPFLDFELHDYFPAWSNKLFPGYALLYANLYVLVINLWPRNARSSFGMSASDGKQLLQALFMSKEKCQSLHRTYYLLETGFLYKHGSKEKALECVDQGLELYPNYPLLLSSKGALLLEMGELEKALSIFKHALSHVDGKQQVLRARLLNDIAYADVIYGGEECIKEADTYSKDAFDAIGWNAAIRGTRGAVLVAVGQVDEGISLLKESMEQIDVLNGKAQNACLLAEAEYLRGNPELGADYLTEARKLDPKCMLIPRVERLLHR